MISYELVCNGYSGSVMDIAGLLWILVGLLYL